MASSEREAKASPKPGTGDVYMKSRREAGKAKGLAGRA